MNKPIGIYTLWRSGSTAYCQHLSSKQGLINFDEMFFNTNAQDKRTLLHNFFPTRQQLVNLALNKYVFKVMPDQMLPEIIDYVEWQVLERRDIETQILSYCYAHHTGKWFEKSNQIVTLPLEFALYFAKYLKLYREVKDQYGWPVVYYEDICHYLYRSEAQPTGNDYRSLITNYKDIIDLVR